jgi:hypothetical protein
MRDVYSSKTWRPTQNTGIIGDIWDFLLPDMPFIFSFYLFKEPLQLLNVPKGKSDADSPSISPYSCNLTSKRK